MTHYAVLWTCTYNTFEKVMEIGVIKLCFNHHYIFFLSLSLCSPHMFGISNRPTEISSVTTASPNPLEKAPCD